MRMRRLPDGRRIRRPYCRKRRRPDTTSHEPRSAAASASRRGVKASWRACRSAARIRRCCSSGCRRGGGHRRGESAGSGRRYYEFHPSHCYRRSSETNLRAARGLSPLWSTDIRLPRQRRSHRLPVFPSFRSAARPKRESRTGPGPRERRQAGHRHRCRRGYSDGRLSAPPERDCRSWSGRFSRRDSRWRRRAKARAASSPSA